MYTPAVLVLIFLEAYQCRDRAGGGDLYRRAGRLLNCLLAEYPRNPVRRVARGHDLLRGHDGRRRPDFWS